MFVVEAVEGGANVVYHPVHICILHLAVSNAVRGCTWYITQQLVYLCTCYLFYSRSVSSFFPIDFFFQFSIDACGINSYINLGVQLQSVD